MILSFSIFHFVLALSTGQLFFAILVILIISYYVSAYWQVLENSNYSCSCWSSALQTCFLCEFFKKNHLSAMWFKACTVVKSSVSGCTCLLHEGLIILPHTLIISARAVSVWAEETSWNRVIEWIYVVVSSLPRWRYFCHAKLKCPGSGFRCVGLIYWKTHIGKVVRQCTFTMSCFKTHSLHECSNTCLTAKRQLLLCCLS